MPTSDEIAATGGTAGDQAGDVRAVAVVVVGTRRDAAAREIVEGANPAAELRKRRDARVNHRHADASSGKPHVRGDAERATQRRACRGAGIGGGQRRDRCVNRDRLDLVQIGHGLEAVRAKIRGQRRDRLVVVLDV